MNIYQNEMKNGVQILIAEDSPTQAAKLTYLLEKSGYRVMAAANGKEALAATREHRPHLIISDVVMPIMDGYTFCQQVKSDENLKSIPFVLLTSLSDPREVIKALQSGADNFFTKPYDDDYFLSRIQSVLDNHQLRRCEDTDFGVEIMFGGQEYLITSERRQIVDLLISTYEAAVNKNSELLRARDELKDLNDQLERKVEERTASLKAEIKERQRAEEEIRRLNAELEQKVIERTAELQAVNKELEAFSYSVSHDLRAPLRSIDGFSLALLQDYTDMLDADGKDALQRVRTATQRMGELIDDLLSLSRVTRSEMRREAMDLSVLVRTVVADLQKREPERQVELVIKAGLAANADVRLIRIVFENLLSNAWKFTGKQPHVRIEFGVTDYKGEQAFFLRDNGAGFDMAYAGKMFGAFQRLHSTTEFPGTGIGLAIVQRIIHRHGGRVWADGEVGRGATFYFTLG